MIIKMIAQGIKTNMYIGILDFEKLNKQPVIVNVTAYGNKPGNPSTISQCLDYSKVCEFVKSWEQRKHVYLVETLLFEVFDFCFAQDSKIFQVEADVIKPNVIDYVDSVGVGASLSREQFMHEKNRKD